MRKIQDHYFKKAKKENYPARSIYKLEEIDVKFHIFSSQMKVLDLGAAPGSWSLYAAQKVGPKGQVIAIDLQSTSTAFPSQVTFFTADMLGEEIQEKLSTLAPFSAVVSDMAPKTTGIKFTDQARSLELCEKAWEVAEKYLKPQGHFVTKIFESHEMNAFRQKLKPHFQQIQIFKPKSTRSESKEIYLIGLKRKVVGSFSQREEGCDEGAG